MPGTGFRIASAYVDVTLDRSALPGELEALAAELSASTGEIGVTAGREIGEGIGKGVGDAPVAEPATRKGTEAGGRFGDAFTARMRAALSSLPPVGVPLDDEDAQVKLDFLREELRSLSDQRIGVDISETDALAKLSYLRAQLDELRAFSPSVQVKTDTAAASAEIDKFLAQTEIKAEAAGQQAGKKLGDGMASSARSVSPLIVGAIATGLIAGGPVISAASILLFAGVGAAAAAGNAQVQASFTALKGHVVADMQQIGDETASEFSGMASDIGSEFDRLQPTIRAALVGVAPELHDVVDAFLQGADTAIPAFTRAIQQGQPIVQGLDALIRDLGSGVAGFMDQITAHAPAAGQDLADIGRIINQALPIIGQLVGEGAELGTEVLPPVAFALHLVGDALHVVGPILPAVAAGFVALKVVQGLNSPLNSLATGLQNIGAKAGVAVESMSGSAAAGERVMTGFSKASGAVTGFAGALGPLGAVAGVAALGIGLITSAVAAHNAQVQQDTTTLANWYKAIASGGADASTAMQNVVNKQKELRAAEQQLAQVQTTVVGGSGRFGAAMQTNSGQAGQLGQKISDLKKEFNDAWQQLTPVEQAQVKLNQAVADYGPKSSQAASAAAHLATVNQGLATQESQVKTATDGAATASQRQQTALQGVSDKASAASTQIGLLRGALDALTGKAVTMDQAEIAVTQAVDAATQAVQGHSAALSFVNGQIDLTNTKSAAASQILIQLAGTQHQEIATMQQQGDTQAQVSASADQMRAQFIQVAEQMGANAGEAQTLADRYFGIPGEVDTTVKAYDAASAVLDLVQQKMNGLHDKTIFIRTYAETVSSGPGSGAYYPEATGGIMLPMAAGGVLAMAFGGHADVFQPNHPTVLVGDNRKVRESFIPQDDSPKSRAVLSETAAAMGFGLVPDSDGGTVKSGPTFTGDITLSFPNVLTLSDPNLPRKLLVAFRDGVRKLEMEAR